LRHVARPTDFGRIPDKSVHKSFRAKREILGNFGKSSARGTKRKRITSIRMSKITPPVGEADARGKTRHLHLPGALRSGAPGRATRNREFAKTPQKREKFFEIRRFCYAKALRAGERKCAIAKLRHARSRVAMARLECDAALYPANDE
jgi:hypothetical protein